MDDPICYEWRVIWIATGKSKISVYGRQCTPTQKRWGIKYSRKIRYQLLALACVLPGLKSFSVCLWRSLQTCFTNNSPTPNCAKAENCLERGLGQYPPQGLSDSLVGSMNNSCKMCISVRKKNHTSHLHPFHSGEDAHFSWLFGNAPRGLFFYFSFSYFSMWRYL